MKPAAPIVCTVVVRMLMGLVFVLRLDAFSTLEPRIISAVVRSLCSWMGVSVVGKGTCPGTSVGHKVSIPSGRSPSRGRLDGTDAFSVLEFCTVNGTRGEGFRIEASPVPPRRIRDEDTLPVGSFTRSIGKTDALP
jgi:hypothetical protein